MVAQRKATPTPITGQTTEATMSLQLAKTFAPDANIFVTNGFTIIGEKGSGKTNALARIIEEISAYHVPLVALDLEGDLLSLVDVMPRGVVATSSTMPAASLVLSEGLQVVIDVSSFESNENAALTFAELLQALMETARTQRPEDRVPCLVIVDEGQYWMPQWAKDSALSKEAQIIMKQAWQAVNKRGRKLGIIPAIATQNIAALSKPCLPGGVYVFLRQSSDTDLERCSHFVHYRSKQRFFAVLRGFRNGRAVVVLPGGEQHTITFMARRSTHRSHTPRIEAALRKFSGASCVTVFQRVSC